MALGGVSEEAHAPYLKANCYYSLSPPSLKLFDGSIWYRNYQVRMQQIGRDRRVWNVGAWGGRKLHPLEEPSLQ